MFFFPVEKLYSFNINTKRFTTNTHSRVAANCQRDTSEIEPLLFRSFQVFSNKFFISGINDFNFSFESFLLEVRQ